MPGVKLRRASLRFEVFNAGKPGHQNEKAPAIDRSPYLQRRRAQLLELGRNAGELGVQRGAKAVDDRDDRNRDASRDEAVLDGRRAGFVLHETHEEVFHLGSS